MQSIHLLNTQITMFIVQALIPHAKPCSFSLQLVSELGFHDQRDFWRTILGLAIFVTIWSILVSLSLWSLLIFDLCVTFLIFDRFDSLDLIHFKPLCWSNQFLFRSNSNQKQNKIYCSSSVIQSLNITVHDLLKPNQWSIYDW